MKNYVTVGIASLDEINARALAAYCGEPQGNYISFLTIEQMWKTLSPNRAATIAAMTGQDVLSIREVAHKQDSQIC